MLSENLIVHSPPKNDFWFKVEEHKSERVHIRDFGLQAISKRTRGGFLKTNEIIRKCRLTFIFLILIVSFNSHASWIGKCNWVLKKMKVPLNHLEVLQRRGQKGESIFVDQKCDRFQRKDTKGGCGIASAANYVQAYRSLLNLPLESDPYDLVDKIYSSDSRLINESVELPRALSILSFIFQYSFPKHRFEIEAKITKELDEDALYSTGTKIELVQNFKIEDLNSDEHFIPVIYVFHYDASRDSTKGHPSVVVQRLKNYFSTIDSNSPNSNQQIWKMVPAELNDDSKSFEVIPIGDNIYRDRYRKGERNFIVGVVRVKFF